MSSTQANQETLVLISGTMGFTLSSKGIEAHDGATYEELSGKRMATHTRKDASKSCTINGIVVNNGESVYIHQTTYLAACFVELKGNKVLIDMATEGSVCIDYNTLITFTNIKLNAPVKVKEASYSIPIKKSNHVMYNGEVMDQRLYEQRNEKHYFVKELKLSEQMYVCHEDGSFTDIVHSTLDTTVYLKKDFSGVPPLLKGIRATADIPKVLNNGERTMELTLKTIHFTGEVDLSFKMIFLTESEYRALHIEQNVLHELQDPIIRYSIYGCYLDENTADYRPTQYLTKLTVYTSNDVPFTSYITRNLKSTQQVDGGVIRTLTAEHLKTDRFYILNDTLHITKDGKITQPIDNKSRFTLYDDKCSTWTTYTKHAEVEVNPTSLINLVEE